MRLLPRLRRKVAVDRAQVKIDEARIRAWLREERTLEHLGAHRHPLPRFGVDYETAIAPASLQRAGVTFVARYLTGAGKALGLGEARELSRAGIDIVSLFEEGGRNCAAGEEQGKGDAHLALHAAVSVGMPRGRPIYFACDFDAEGEGLTGRVLGYLRGAAAVLGRDYEAALYAGRGPVTSALLQGYVHFAYQTLAWSGGVWEPRAQLRQTRVEYQGEPRIGGTSVDYDEAVAADFGQWRL